MALRAALYLALPCLAEPRAVGAAEHAAAAVAALAEHFRVHGATRRLSQSGVEDSCVMNGQLVPIGTSVNVDCNSCWCEGGARLVCTAMPCSAPEPDPYANLDASCRAELQPTVETLSSPVCQAELAELGQLNAGHPAGVLTNRRVEEMCTSTCLHLVLDLIDHDCFAQMAGDGSDARLSLGLSMYADIVRAMCVTNEHGDYCGTKFGLAQSNAQGSAQCGVLEDMGCCFAEVAHVMTSAMEQQPGGGQSIDFAALWAAMCNDHDIETEKCPDHFGLSTGAIVGIVLGSLAGVACLGALIFLATRAGKQAPPAAQPGMLLGQPQPQPAKDVAWPEP